MRRSEPCPGVSVLRPSWFSPFFFVFLAGSGVGVFTAGAARELQDNVITDAITMLRPTQSFAFSLDANPEKLDAIAELVDMPPADQQAEAPALRSRWLVAEAKHEADDRLASDKAACAIVGIGALEAAAGKDPGNIVLRKRIAKHYVDEVEREFPSKSEKLSPGSSPSVAFLKATAAIQAALELDPSDAVTLMRAASLYSHQRDKPEPPHRSRMVDPIKAADSVVSNRIKAADLQQPPISLILAEKAAEQGGPYAKLAQAILIEHDPRPDELRAMAYTLRHPGERLVPYEGSPGVDVYDIQTGQFIRHEAGSPGGIRIDSPRPSASAVAQAEAIEAKATKLEEANRVEAAELRKRLNQQDLEKIEICQ